jgi:hypothetical protein
LLKLLLSAGSVDVLIDRQESNVKITVTRREGDVVVVIRY